MCFHSGSLFLDRGCSGSSPSWSKRNTMRERGKTESKEGLSGGFKERATGSGKTTQTQQRLSEEASGAEAVMVTVLWGKKRGLSVSAWGHGLPLTLFWSGNRDLSSFSAWRCHTHKNIEQHRILAHPQIVNSPRFIAFNIMIWIDTTSCGRRKITCTFQQCYRSCCPTAAKSAYSTYIGKSQTTLPAEPSFKEQFSVHKVFCVCWMLAK